MAGVTIDGTMRHAWASLGIALAVTLCSCGGSTETASSSDQAKSTVEETAKSVALIQADHSQLRVSKLEHLLNETAHPVSVAVSFIPDGDISRGIGYVRDDTSGNVYAIVAARASKDPGKQVLPKEITIASVGNDGTVWCASPSEPSPSSC